MASIPADQEWISFSARSASDHLLDPETPLRNPETINYPSREDPSVIPVHTAAGSSAKSHKFHIEGRKDGTGSIKTGSLRVEHPGQHAWRFRTRPHEDIMEWWNDVRVLCARYLAASDALERSGAVAAAARAAGYVSEEEEDSEEGSSVEEEQHSAEEEVLPPGAHPHDVSEPAQPGYLYTHHASCITWHTLTRSWRGKLPESTAPHTDVDAVADAEDETDGAGHAEVAGVGAGGSAGGDNTVPRGRVKRFVTADANLMAKSLLLPGDRPSSRVTPVTFGRPQKCTPPSPPSW
ncbi:hypothetical protein EDB86DRAFT_3088328 [Lactarius hatsudake]|nr:hypothetical protein EDB86DRAFT_3088328 [Lactarius hatsudake]